MTNAINFVIKANGSTNNKTQFVAETVDGALLATISPRLMANSKYSARFLNICFLDGAVEIADRCHGETKTSHASEIIAAKLFI